MSQIPGGLVTKRYLNAWRPAGGVVPPPIGGLLIFNAVTLAPGGVVTGNAETERDEFLSYLTVSGAQGYEEPDWENGFVLDDHATVSNGNSANVTATSMPSISVNVAGRFNTTPGGALHVEISSTMNPKWSFVGNMAGFGFFVTDAGDFDATWTVRVTDENAVVTDYALNSGGEPNGNLRFWGFLDNSGLEYVSVEVFCDDTLSGDAIGIDDVYIVNSTQFA